MKHYVQQNLKLIEKYVEKYFSLIYIYNKIKKANVKNMAKKTTNKKISSSKTKKTVDVSNVDAIMEDMKNLALQETEDEKVESDVNVDMKDIDIVTTQSPTIETENLVNTEQSMLEDTNNVEEQNLSFVEEINNGEVIVEDETKVEEKPKDIENKPKRKSYSEMFGSTWCGYGYTY